MSNIQDAERCMQVMKRNGKEPYALVCRREWYAAIYDETSGLSVETVTESPEDVTIYNMQVCVAPDDALPDSRFVVVTKEELGDYITVEEIDAAEVERPLKEQILSIIGERRWLRSGFDVYTAVCTAVRQADDAKTWRKRMRWELSQAAGIDEDDYTAMLAEVRRMRAALDAREFGEIDHHGDLAEALDLAEPESWSWKGMLDDVRLANAHWRAGS